MGKRYRETKPVFSIEDDDDEAGIWLFFMCLYNLVEKLTHCNANIRACMIFPQTKVCIV
jgi:hypothetical protein